MRITNLAVALMAVTALTGSGLVLAEENASAPAAAPVAHNHAIPAVDARTVVPLPAADRALVLAEMRAFLAGLQSMTVALAQADMAAVAEHSQALGKVMTQGVPPSLMQKLPQEFRQLGFSVHDAFDSLALNAREMGDSAQTLAQLGDILQRCVACHSTYRLEVQAE